MALFPPIDASPERVREALSPLRNDFSVAVFRCQNAFAVGAIIRVAHSFLAREIVLVGDEPYYEKASMGMEKFESVISLADEASFFAHCGGRPIFALERETARRSLYDTREFPRDVVFVFGSERFGLPTSVLAKVDEIIAIPMYGINNSFPVAVAAGIVMSEWARRHYRDGHTIGAQTTEPPPAGGRGL